MYEAYAYNPESTTRISETATVINGKILLRHIPKPDSIQINGFVETASYNVRPNQFRCHYSEETWYRETDRTIYFNPTHNGEVLNISYIVVGTVLTTDIWNEIKAHLENDSIHGGSYELPTASADEKGGVKVGAGLSMNGDTLNCTVQGGGSVEGFFQVKGNAFDDGDYDEEPEDSDLPWWDITYETNINGDFLPMLNDEEFGHIYFQNSNDPPKPYLWVPNNYSNSDFVGDKKGTYVDLASIPLHLACYRGDPDDDPKAPGAVYNDGGLENWGWYMQFRHQWDSIKIGNKYYDRIRIDTPEKVVEFLGAGSEFPDMWDGSRIPEYGIFIKQGTFYFYDKENDDWIPMNGGD